jgi:hypothetical protein
MSVPIFHRTALAQAIARRALSPKGLSGVFISAPRRTGKSTLIKEDMLPFMEQQGAEVIYVDLWQNRDRDPGELISEAVTDHLRKRENVLLQFARKSGLDKVKAGGLEIDMAKVGSVTGKSFTKALAELSDATRSMIVLVIDEVQHAATTAAGATALFSLKAARDELNGSAHHGFRLIATGSNRDKLHLLVQGRDQAFMGAATMDLEPLGADFLAWELDLFTGPFRPSLETVERVFRDGGHRPETLRKALDDLEFRFDVTAENVDEKFEQCFLEVIDAARRAFMQQVDSLPPLQAAVLTVMARKGNEFAPFRPATVELYESECARLSRDRINVDDSAIQYALEALRTKSLVWKSSRGVYAIEDSQHAAWLIEGPPQPERSAEETQRTAPRKKRPS